MRQNFEMTQKQLDTILDACKPVVMIALNCGTLTSPQENANRAWAKLGKELGFKFRTVLPSNKGRRFFSAESLEED